MPIQIQNINVIDDSRNLAISGVATVGSGSSATVINGNTGVVNVGTGITLNGSSGNISIGGTIYASGFNVPASLVSFSPADGATNVSLTADIVLTFNQAVGVATTGTIQIRTGSAGGTTVRTYGVSQLQPTVNGIVIPATTAYGLSTSIYPVIPNGLIKTTGGSFIGLNTTGASSYSFTTRGPNLGESYEGGYLICQSGGVRWVVSPTSAEVSRSWYARGDASSVAQQVSGCTGWFVPTCAQLQNPGYQCRTYWDAYRCARYWSSTQDGGIFYAFSVDMTNNDTSFYGPGGNPSLNNLRSNTKCIRSFRCVTY